MLDLDKTTWQRVKFGDVVKNANTKSTDPAEDGIDRVIAMEHLDPGELAIRRWGTLDTGTTFTRRVTPGQTLFGKRRAYQRKVAYAEFDAICSGDILTFEAVPEKLLPELLPFIVQSDPFFERAVGTSAGSLSPRTNWRDLAKFEFDLPPLDEQKRIADLLWAVERHARSLAETALQARTARCELVTDLLSRLPDKKPIGDFATIRSGPSYPASDSHSSPVPGSQPVLGITNTLPDGTMDLSQVSHVTGLTASTQTIDSSTLVLIRTNGNRDRIGNVYVPPESAEGYAVSAFQFLLKVEDPRLRDYVFTVLDDRKMQANMSENASGTTGLGNLSSRWLKSREVAWSDDPTDRAEVVSGSATAREAEALVAGERDDLSKLRSSLLSSIFGDS